MKKKLLIVTLSVLMLMTTGCVKTPKLEDGKEIIAEINGKQYTADDLFDELKEKYGTTELVNMIDKYIISQELTDTSSEESEAKSYIAQMKEYYEKNGQDWSTVLSNNGYTEDTLQQYYAFNYEKDTVAKKYYKSQVSDDDINNYYNDNIIGDITAKQILITPDTTDSMTDEEKASANTDAYNKALEVIEKLNNGEDFSELAKEYSDDESASEGGTLAPFNKQSNYPTEFLDAATKLEVGSYSTTPIKTTYGYHILYIVSKDEKPSLDDVKDDIISTLSEKAIDADENYVQVAWKAIRSNYGLNIYDTVINEKYDQVMSQY